MIHLSDTDILEWTMGWSRPIITLLGVLIVWGISRFLSWDEKDGEQRTHTAGEACACQCDAQ